LTHEYVRFDVSMSPHWFEGGCMGTPSIRIRSKGYMVCWRSLHRLPLRSLWELRHLGGRDSSNQFKL